MKMKNFDSSLLPVGFLVSHHLVRNVISANWTNESDVIDRTLIQTLFFNVYPEFISLLLPSDPWPAGWPLAGRSLWPCGSCCGWTMICLWAWSPVCCQPPPSCWCSALQGMQTTLWLSGERRQTGRPTRMFSVRNWNCAFVFQMRGCSGRRGSQHGSLPADWDSGATVGRRTDQEAPLGSVFWWDLYFSLFSYEA